MTNHSQIKFNRKELSLTLFKQKIGKKIFSKERP